MLARASERHEWPWDTVCRTRPSVGAVGTQCTTAAQAIRGASGAGSSHHPISLAVDKS